MTEHSLRPRLIKAADTTGRAIELSSGAVCVVLGAAMVTVTLLGVFFRYVLGSPLQWTEELARFLMLWLGFLAMNLAMRQGQHISIDFLVAKFPRPLSTVTAYAVDLMIAYFLVVLTVKGYGMTAKTMMKASSMSFSMSWVYSAVPIGAGLTLVQLVLNVLKRLMSEFGAAQPVS